MTLLASALTKSGEMAFGLQKKEIHPGTQCGLGAGRGQGGPTRSLGAPGYSQRGWRENSKKLFAYFIPQPRTPGHHVS